MTAISKITLLAQTLAGDDVIGTRVTSDPTKRDWVRIPIAALIGNAGPAGVAGVTGPIGPQGLPGTVGGIGPAGAAGGVGPAGAASSVAGPSGSIGPAGIAGPAGSAGPAGVTGATSTVPGPAGSTGPAGGIGPAGAASTVPGPVGSTGPAGGVGSAGAASTVAGPQGIQGVQGPVGPAGAAGGGSLSPVSTVYTASGAIALTDTFAAINSTTATSMTLANGTTDGANLTIKRIGSGTVKLAATIDGAAQFALFTSAGTLRESVNLSWSASLATWLLKASAVAFTSSTSNPPSAQYWRIRILAASGGDGYTQLGRLFFSGADGVNLATGIAWAETSTYSGGNLSPGGPGWISGQGGVYPQNVRYNFGSPVAIYTVALTSGPDAVFNRSPTSFVIEYSSDDVTYTPRNTCTPAAWTAQGQVQTFAVS